MKPAIVLSAYNRPQTLERLLISLQKEAYPAGRGVPLIISIDCGENGIHPEVRKVAEQFVWPFGPKEVLCHERHLGLVEQVLFCGGLTGAYGDVTFFPKGMAV